MTEGPSWDPTFKRVAQIPGRSAAAGKQQLTEQELLDRNRQIERRRAADIAIAHGMVDDGVQDPWAWLAGWSNGVQESLTANTDAIATLEDIAAASRSTQAYVANIQDMPTCARRDVASFGWSTNKWIDIDEGVFCAFDDHFHRIGITCLRPVAEKGSTLGHIYYTPIIVDRVGTLEGLRWMVGAEATSIDYYEVALCALDPLTGNIVKLWGSGDIKGTLPPVPSDPGTLEAYAEFGFVTPQVTQPGELLFFAHQQTAPGLFQVTRRLAAAIAPPAERPDQLLDASCYVAEEHTQGIPSSIPLASLTREHSFIPWGAARVFALEGDE